MQYICLHVGTLMSTMSGHESYAHGPDRQADKRTDGRVHTIFHVCEHFSFLHTCYEAGCICSAFVRSGTMDVQSSLERAVLSLECNTRFMF